MGDWSLLKTMVVKEVRSTFRERSQTAGIFISIAVLVVVAGGAIYQMKIPVHKSRHHMQLMSVIVRNTLGLPVMSQAAVLWAIIALGAVVGFFFSMGYLMSAVLACFVGEKEAKTLEILLAAPLSDRKLFALKCAGTLIPSIAIGAFFLFVIALLFYIFTPMSLSDVSPGIFFGGVALSVPLLILVQICLLGIGAAISLKADTMKGASQIFGVVFMVVFFGCGYGIPFLLMWSPSLRAALLRWAITSMKFNFGGQYAVVLIVFCIPAGLCVSVARACFQRDRLLS